MEFLDHQATFLGTLLTLNVLCLFAEDSNNFIRGILKSESTQLNERLTTHHEQLKQKIESFQEEKIYDTLDKIAKDTGISVEPKERQSANLALLNLKASISQSQTYLYQASLSMDRVHKTDEQVRAPLYTLMYGILIFTINLLVSEKGEYLPAIKFGIWLLTLLSWIYWMTLWAGFAVSKWQKKDFKVTDYDRDARKVTYWQKFDDKWRWHLGALIKMMLALILFSISLVCFDNLIHNIIKEGAFSWFVILFYISAILVIIGMGISREISCTHKGKYSVQHVWGHLGAISLYSLLLVVLYHFISKGTLETSECLKIITPNDYWLGISIILFVLIVGIIFPFIFPYTKYKSIYSETTRLLDEQEDTVDDTIKTLREVYNKIAQQVLESTISGKTSAVTPSPSRIGIIGLSSHSTRPPRRRRINPDSPHQ